MEAVAKCSNLVLPKGFVELDREEMTYVDGGAVYKTVYTNIDGIMYLATKVGAGVVATIKGIGIAAATGVSVVGAILGAVLAVTGIVSASWNFCNLISAIISFRDGSYTIEERKFWGITYLTLAY